MGNLYLVFSPLLGQISSLILIVSLASRLLVVDSLPWTVIEHHVINF